MKKAEFREAAQTQASKHIDLSKSRRQKKVNFLQTFAFCNSLINVDTGVSGIFDVKPYSGGSAFKELADESYFRLVRPAHHGITWPHEQDCSSDTIIWDIQNA